MEFAILGLIVFGSIGLLAWIVQRNRQPGALKRSIWPTSAAGVMGLAVLVILVFGTAFALLASSG